MRDNNYFSTERFDRVIAKTKWCSFVPESVHNMWRLSFLLSIHWAPWDSAWLQCVTSLVHVGSLPIYSSQISITILWPVCRCAVILLIHTKEVVSREVVRVPDLQIESSWNFGLCLIPREHIILAWYYYFLLSHEVVKWKHESPVEIAFSCQRSVQQHIVAMLHKF